VLQAEEEGVCGCRIVGLGYGGTVTAELDGKRVSCELLSQDENGPASAAVLRLDLVPGRHVLRVREEAGVQFFRVEGTTCYLATGTAYGGKPVFRLDFAARNEEYPIEIRYGPDFEPFFWLSGKWDQYPAPSYTEEACGLIRGDGSALILGLGREKSRFRLPAESRKNVHSRVPREPAVAPQLRRRPHAQRRGHGSTGVGDGCRLRIGATGASVHGAVSTEADGAPLGGESVLRQRRGCPPTGPARDSRDVAGVEKAPPAAAGVGRLMPAKGQATRAPLPSLLDPAIFSPYPRLRVGLPARHFTTSQ
jgi:hypothetical protein